VQIAIFRHFHARALRLAAAASAPRNDRVIALRETFHAACRMRSGLASPLLLPRTRGKADAAAAEGIDLTLARIVRARASSRATAACAGSPGSPRRPKQRLNPARCPVASNHRPVVVP